MEACCISCKKTSANKNSGFRETKLNNGFLLTRDKFITELHLGQSGFT